MIQEQSPQGHAHQLFHSCFWFESFNRSADLPFQATSSPSPHGQVVNSKRGLWLGSQQKLRLSNLSFTVVGLVVLSCRICQNMQVVRIPEDTSRILKVTSVHLLVKGKKNAIHGTAFGQKKAMNPIESQSADLSIDFITSPSTSTVSASGLEMA